ncbi:uncharacterized protein LOC121728220 [Aricia agestis]|uniref:uncharacterized protein LOC121728220 n=1 Tax=Aricia agestis TaxID=91739 RepID=UPI001C202DC8|nr:uncharacterized protein LOC121728220 [Aricia agestis]
MQLIQFVWFLSLFLACFCSNYTRIPERKVEFCEKQGQDPYFDVELLVGKKWRVYYTWNMIFDSKCYDTVFKRPTKETIQRIRSDMKDYLQHQPRWSTAALHVITRVGSSEHELLMFPDQGPAGRFLAVPNVVRTPDNFPLSKRVQLLKIFIKLVANGKYLLVMDCVMRGASLSAHAQPYRAEVATHAAALQVEGPGYPACTREKHKNEMIAT